MRSAPAPSGTLEEGQVRAMFDRIAGFYDVMNSVMTAGLHHRWRERAADLAQVGPGARALDVATGTGDLALELARRVRPGRRGDRLRLLGGDARARAHEGGWRAGRELGVGQRARAALRRRRLRRCHGRLRRPQLLRPRARAGRDGPGRAPGRPRRRARDHDARPARPCRRSSRSGSIASCRRSARFAADPEAYTYLPKSVKRFPGPEPLAAAMARAGLTDVRWILTAGGIIALHSGTVA